MMPITVGAALLFSAGMVVGMVVGPLIWVLYFTLKM